MNRNYSKMTLLHTLWKRLCRGSCLFKVTWRVISWGTHYVCVVPINNCFWNNWSSKWICLILYRATSHCVFFSRHTSSKIVRWCVSWFTAVEINIINTSFRSSLVSNFIFILWLKCWFYLYTRSIYRFVSLVCFWNLSWVSAFLNELDRTLLDNFISELTGICFSTATQLYWWFRSYCVFLFIKISN